MTGLFETTFKLIVGKSKISYTKDKIRRLESLRDNYEDQGMLENPEVFEALIRKEYDNLARLEEKEMQRK